MAAYTLPAAAGALVLARWLSRVPARRLVIANGMRRASALGTVVGLHLLGHLTTAWYVALLAGSSLLPAVLAARGAVTTAAMPLGAALGGPLVTALRVRGSLLASGLATVGLVLLTAGTLVCYARARRPITAGRRPGLRSRRVP